MNGKSSGCKMNARLQQSERIKLIASIGNLAETVYKKVEVASVRGINRGK